MSKCKITVHVAEACLCGQMHEMVYHMKSADLSTHAKFPAFAEVFTEFKPFVELEHNLEFSGKYSDVTFNGTEFNGKTIVCKGCRTELWPCLEDTKV